MAANVQKVDLVDIDLNSGNISRSWLNHTIGMADNKGNAFGVRVFRDGEAVTLSSVSVQGHFRDPHGTNISITDSSLVSVSGNIAYVILPQACYNYEGQFCLAIKLVGGGVTGTMRIVDGMVSNTNTSNPVTPTTVPTYQEILALYDEMQDAADVANDAIAPEYSDLEFPVVKGELCIYNGHLYRAKQDISSSETWTSGHWETTTFGMELKNEESARQLGDMVTQNDMAVIYNEALPYDAGKIVIKDGVTYLLPNGHTAGTAWASTTKTIINLSDHFAGEASELKSAINDTNITIANYAVGQETANPDLFNIDYSWIGVSSQERYYSGTAVGDTISESSGSNALAKVAKVPASVGEIFYISADGASSSRAYYVIDSDGEIIQIASSNAHYVDSKIVIDSGAAYLIVQSKYATNWKVVKKGNLEKELAQINDIIDYNIDIFEIDYSSSAESNAWYTGTTVGGTLTKSVVSNTKSMKIAVEEGQKYSVTCVGGSSGRAWYTLDSSEKVVALSAGSTTYEGYEIEIASGVSYLLVQTNNTAKFGVIKNSVIDMDVEVYDNAIDRIAYFSGKTKFLDSKLARLKATDSGIVNIAFIGDSWTQGTQDSISSGQYETYVKWLAKSLWQKYGFAGFGWLDFARDGGENKMFGCADLYEHWSYSFSGTVTGLDGSTAADAPNCLGICCAHTIFSNGASLTLNFDAGYLDKFYIRYYKNAHFTVSVNGGTATEITANGTDGWQETLLGSTGTDTTSVVITSLADNTIIFGMDCYYGLKGIRCHKVGNRSLSLDNYLLMDATQFETGIALLGVSWTSILFAINDLGSSAADSRCLEIVDNYTAFINRLKAAYTSGGIFPVDIAILGCDEIESTSYHALPKLEGYLMDYALDKKYSWCSTKGCIGGNQAELGYTGLFSDQIHLNKAGSMLFGGYIFEHLFESMGL